MIEKPWTRRALISCNVSWKNEISEEKLIDILMNRCEVGEWLGHIDVFFNELPKSIIIGFLQENKISYTVISRVFHSLPSSLQGNNFRRIFDKKDT